MNFLAPVFLWGLPLVAVPVIIHLLNRRQRKPIGWGAMRFLARAATRKRRIWRVTDWLLLALRVAAVLLFVLALARPLLSSAWLHGAVPREVVLVLDRSLSMTRRVDGATLFERQRDEAERLLGELTGADSVRVLLAGDTPEWLTPEPVPASSGALRALRERMAEVKPGMGAANLVAALREGVEVEAPKDKVLRVVYLISDAQRSGWRTEEDAAWTALRSRLEGSAIPTVVGWRWVTGAEPGGNLAVTRLETPRPHAASGQTLAFSATIRNHGRETSPATLLAWRVDGQPSGVTTVPALGPGTSTVLTFAQAFTRPGEHEVNCVLEANDELPGDDAGRCLVDVFERLPVLVVADEQDAASAEGDATFLLAALGVSRPGAPASEWKSVFEPTVVLRSGLGQVRWSDYRCVIWADGGPLAPEVEAALSEQVRDGVGLWLALGGRTAPDDFNATWFRGGAGMAPLRLGEPTGDPDNRERFVTVRASAEVHPATALLADLQRLDLDRARVYRRHVFEIGAARNVSVLLQASGGEPVAVERTYGRGRVVVQGVPLGISWSTLPLCQAYVAMVHEWLWHLSGGGLPRRNLEVGETLSEAAPAAGTEATLSGASGAVTTLRSERLGRSHVFREARVRESGAYTLTWKAADGTAREARYEVARRPEESDLARLEEKDREVWAGCAAMRGEATLGELTAGSVGEAPRHPLEGWLLGALPFVLLGEMAMAGWATRRRLAKPQPVAIEG